MWEKLVVLFGKRILAPFLYSPNLHGFLQHHPLHLSHFLMLREMRCFLVLFLQILSLVGASSRHLDHAKVTAQNFNTLPATRISSEGMRSEVGLMEGAGANKAINKIGSSPPSCAHKCYGCMPCEAIQVPTTTGRVRVQYANYEPEGWKCKCGPTFYSP